jgi:methionyl-tRNA synthetase
MRDGLKIVLNISKLGNQYIQANKPWVLIKGNDDERYIGISYFLIMIYMFIYFHPWSMFFFMVFKYFISGQRLAV